MKFLKGIVFGSAVGLALGVVISQERRVDLIRRARSLPRRAADRMPDGPTTPSLVEDSAHTTSTVAV